MRLSSALLTIVFGMNAQAQNRHTVIPHVDEDGGVTWTATIDATTAKGFENAGTRSDGSYYYDYHNLPLVALSSWLDNTLSSVGWCPYGWYYLVEDPKYIEKLSDGQLRVKGRCRKPPP